MATILLVEDEQDIQEILAYNLGQAGHCILTALTGPAGLDLARTALPELVILDIMLPGMSGIDVCRAIKSDPATQHIPIVMLTAKSSEIDRVVGFELGAEDYVVKPFSVREVVLRIAAVLRRSKRDLPAVVSDEARTVTFSRLRFDRAAHRVWVYDREITLTPTEFKLLCTLFDRRGRVQPRSILLGDIWGISGDVETRTIDTHVRRLREKLAEAGEYIETVRGSGYRFIAEPGHPSRE